MANPPRPPAEVPNPSDRAAADLAAAVAHHRAGELEQAELLYRAVLETDPDTAEALHNLALLLRGKGEGAAAETLVRRVLALCPDLAAAHNSLGNLLSDAGRAEEAAAAYAEAVARKPNYAEAYFNLAGAEMARGRPDAAAESLGQAIRLRPGFAAAHRRLGEVEAARERYEAAAIAFAEAARLDPSAAAASLDSRGVMLQRLGRFAEAEAAHGRAIALDPAAAEPHNNLGTALQRQGRPAEAAEAYREAVRRQPDHVGALTNLGAVLQALGRFAEASAALEQALSLAPDAASAWINLGLAHQRLGHIAPAEECFRRAMALRPEDPAAHSNLIFLLDFDPARDVAAQQAERARWTQAHAANLPRFASHDNPPEPGRRLRIGYLSADFRAHSAAFAFASVLLNHDPRAYEILCYSGTLREDEWSARFRAAARLWRPVSGMSDQALAERIRRDRVDILVDLSGHSAGNRLLTMARKPAPIQLSAWGHVNGTGLAEIDCLLADPVLIPPAEAPFFAERIYYLPSAFSLTAPDDLPDLVPPPALSGRPTFGCLNRLSKLTEASIEIFAAVLKKVPDADLLLKAREFEDEGARAETIARFAARGIGAARLRLAGASDRARHLAAYNEVDVALDPLPHGGGMSTMEALWMGVPVVALAGLAPSHRMAASILAAAGLGDFISRTPEEYVAIASAAAADRDRLGFVRAGLRARLGARPLGNGPLYARLVEEAYRALWRDWCRERGA